MPTRFYLPATSAAPAISPAVTGWTLSASNFARVRAVTAKTATALADQAYTSTSTSIGATSCFKQYVYGPLGAQTISGTLTGVIRGLESNATHNATVAICVRRVNSAGVHQANVLAVSASDATTTPPEFGTTASTRRFQDAAEAVTLALTSTVFSQGDYLVIEIGARKGDTAVNRSVTLRFGDSAATDFAHTDALTTDLNPWVEVSGTISLLVYKNLTGTAAGASTADWRGQQAATQAGPAVRWACRCLRHARHDDQLGDLGYGCQVHHWRPPRDRAIGRAVRVRRPVLPQQL